MIVFITKKSTEDFGQFATGAFIGAHHGAFGLLRDVHDVLPVRFSKGCMISGLDATGAVQEEDVLMVIHNPKKWYS